MRIDTTGNATRCALPDTTKGTLMNAFTSELSSTMPANGPYAGAEIAHGALSGAVHVAA